MDASARRSSRSEPGTAAPQDPIRPREVPPPVITIKNIRTTTSGNNTVITMDIYAIGKKGNQQIVDKVTYNQTEHASRVIARYEGDLTKAVTPELSEAQALALHSQGKLINYSMTYPGVSGANKKFYVMANVVVVEGGVPRYATFVTDK